MHTGLLGVTALLVLGCGYSFDMDEPASDDIPRQRKLPSMMAPAVSESQVGAPFYPSSRITSIDRTGPETSQTLTVEFSTRDAPADVAAFYREQLGKPDSESTGPETLTYNGESGVVVIRIEPTERGAKIRIENSPSKQ